MSLAHFNTYCPLQDKDNYKHKDKDKDKDKDSDKDKDNILKRHNMCYVFEKLRVQGYQI